MQLRTATGPEIRAFLNNVQSPNGAESDHQDEFVGATAIDTGPVYGLIVCYTTRDDIDHFVHVSGPGADVSDPLFFINLRALLPHDVSE